MVFVPKAIRPYQGIGISMIILAVCIAGVVFGVVPALAKIQEMSAAAKTLREDTNTLNQKLTVLNALDEETLRNQLITVMSAVPADRSYPTVFETVEGLSAQTGASIRSMSISGSSAIATSSANKATADEKKLGTHTVHFNVALEGTIDTLTQFISLAPKVRRLLRLRTFSISFPDDDRPVNITLEMDSFYEPLPSSIGSAKATLPQLSEAEMAVIDKLGQLPLATRESAELPPPLIGKVKDNPFLQ